MRTKIFDVKKLFYSLFLSFLFVCNISFAKGTPDDFADLVEKLLPAVVSISSSNKLNSDDGSIHQVASLGSGFIVDAKGIVVTNYHVIENTEEIIVGLLDGNKYAADIVGIDEELDISVLKIKRNEPFPFVSFTNSETARVGNWVIAIGNPFSLDGTVSAGIVSARRRDINLGHFDNFIQTDASINRGNSGGPLFNMDGKVIGVNSAIFSSNGESVGIGFSVPSNLVVDSVDQLLKYGEVRRGYIGATVGNILPSQVKTFGLTNNNGAIVVSVTPDSPAHYAGLKPNDIIVSYNGSPIRDSREFIFSIISTPIGKEMPLTIIRNSKLANLTVKVAKRLGNEKFTEAMSSSSANSFMGISFYNVNAETKRLWGLSPELDEGVLVGAIERGSSAMSLLQPGDIILEAGWKKVDSPSNLVKVLQDLKIKSSAPVQIYLQRGNRQFSLKLDLE